MIMNVRLDRKENGVKTTACNVAKIIELPSARFYHFSRNMLSDFDFLRENRDVMHYKDGIDHCLLVLDKDGSDGVLVDSQGYDYARYSAYVPGARELLAMQGLPPDMRRALELAPAMVNWMTSQATEGQNALSISLPELEDRFDVDISLNPGVQDILGHVLGERPGIMDIGIGDDTLDFTFDPQVLAKTTQEVEMEMIL